MSEERLPWISADPASQRVFELAQKVAGAPTTLLISGESGAGKDYLARVIHELGPRRDAPFLKIDCASLPPQLVESELFGHERGSCCAFCKNARLSGWAEPKRCASKRGWWR